MIPLTLSVLLSFGFYPLLKQMHYKLHFPWVLSIILIVLLVIVLFITIGNLLFSSLKTIASVYPKYEARFTTIYKTVAETFKIPFDSDLSLFTNLWNSLNVRNAVQNFAISLSSQIFSFSKDVLMIILLSVFLLLEMRSLKTKTDYAFKGSLNEKIDTISSKTINEVTRYISIKFIISLLTGFFVFLGTLFIHLDFPIIWGFIAFILNFIPNFGSIISGLLTILFSFLQFYPSWPPILFVACLMLGVNMILGNIIEPRWEGTDLGLSPFVILVSLALWGWMWGFVGMILAVPIMVILKIICENISFLQPIAVLLGNAPRHPFQKETEANTEPEQKQKDL